MGPFLLGLAVLLLFLVAAYGFVSANPRRMAENVVTGGAILCFLGGGALILLGRFGLAMPLFVLGTSLVTRRIKQRQATPAGGRTSRVRTGMVEMELDHDSGAMRGTIRSGPYAGQSLDGMPPKDLLELWRTWSNDPQSRALLEAYLDRRMPGWRADREADADTRSGGGAGAGPMSQQEAYEILGLQPGASAEEIRRAHRTLMKKLHPDQGGSTYLAARVNEAKEILLRGHR